MAKKTYTEEPQPIATPQLESQETILEEVIKPHIEDYISKRVKDLRAKGFDNNRIAATLMIHKHIVDDIK
jgi:uncharacterized protein (UPF0335 family)